MARGKHSMVPREDDADAENNGSTTGVASHSSKDSSSVKTMKNRISRNGVLQSLTSTLRNR
jgi:hypothetical protein